MVFEWHVHLDNEKKSFTLGHEPPDDFLITGPAKRRKTKATAKQMKAESRWAMYLEMYAGARVELGCEFPWVFFLFAVSMLHVRSTSANSR